MAAFPGKTQQELSVLEALIAGHSVFTFGAPPCVYDPDSQGTFGKVHTFFKELELEHRHTPSLMGCVSCT
jgi:hypothetical protein